MFNSVKEKIYSAVQEGIESNNVLRKLAESKPAKRDVPKFPERAAPSSASSSGVNLNAGAELLDKYEREWRAMHEESERNARLAEAIDARIVDVHAAVDDRLRSAAAASGVLAQLPRLSATIDRCAAQIGDVAALARAVEDELSRLEDLVERSDFRRRQNEHLLQLTMYKEKKFAELERSHVELAKQKATAAKEAELRQRNALLERQRAAHDAFLQDLDRYKTKGELPKIEQTTDDSEINATLEDIHLTNDDSDELDDFLNK